MHDMIRGRVFEAPLPDPHLFATPPTMNLISRTPQGRGVLGRSAGEPCTAGETERLDLELRLPQPGVGVLNVTGSLQGWSFSKPLPKSSSKVRCCKSFARCVSTRSICHPVPKAFHQVLAVVTALLCHVHGDFMTLCTTFFVPGLLLHKHRLSSVQRILGRHTLALLHSGIQHDVDTCGCHSILAAMLAVLVFQLLPQLRGPSC